nr:2774_t:CDS:2 [Entrophospora candida]
MNLPIWKLPAEWSRESYGALGTETNLTDIVVIPSIIHNKEILFILQIIISRTIRKVIDI